MERDEGERRRGRERRKEREGGREREREGDILFSSFAAVNLPLRELCPGFSFHGPQRLLPKSFGALAKDPKSSKH